MNSESMTNLCMTALQEESGCITYLYDYYFDAHITASRSITWGEIIITPAIARSMLDGEVRLRHIKTDPKKAKRS